MIPRPMLTRYQFAHSAGDPWPTAAPGYDGRIMSIPVTFELPTTIDVASAGFVVKPDEL